MEWFSKNSHYEEVMMNAEQIKVSYDLLRLGIGLESVKLFPGIVKRFNRINNTCFMLETSREKFALWLVAADEPKLLAELELISLLKEKGTEGFLFPVRLKNNSFHGILEDGRLFYLTNWPELRPISLRNDLCVKSLLQIVVNFRKIMNQSDLSILNIKMSGKSLVDRYQDMIRSFQSFTMLASYRLNPSKFDRIILEHSKQLVEEAELALKLIQGSGYLKMFEEKESFRPIINNLSRSNLRALPTGQAICLSLKESALDLPLVDLLLLMVKTGRANGWSQEWCDFIIGAYHESFPLTNKDLKVIQAYLAFPWESHRLAARYYHNRVNWPARAFVEKMERILESRGARKKLVQSLS